VSKTVTIYKLNIEFESEHDWNEMRDVLEDWEMTGIARVDGARNIERWYDGADSSFSARAEIDSKEVN
tara:strand:- start:1521 stop:1724 length:204 start_codon:yes stop_codon:yes gene_type:complete